MCHLLSVFFIKIIFNWCLFSLFQVPSVPGILARDYETLVMVCKLLLDKGYLRRYFDPDLLPIPWNEPVIAFSVSIRIMSTYGSLISQQMYKVTTKLRIGFYQEFDYFPTTPGVRRAVKVAKEKLEALGHELVPFVPPHVDLVISSVISMFYADQGRYVLEAL